MNNEEYKGMRELGFDDVEFVRYGDFHYQPPAVPWTNDPDARLAYPSYRDSIWQKPQVIYGAEEAGLDWVYSDRIWGWDRNKAEVAAEHANSIAKGRTARWAEEFCRSFFDQPELEVVCIMGGCNQSNGYEYYCYGYKSQP